MVWMDDFKLCRNSLKSFSISRPYLVQLINDTVWDMGEIYVEVNRDWYIWVIQWMGLRGRPEIIIRLYLDSRILTDFIMTVGRIRLAKNPQETSRTTVAIECSCKSLILLLSWTDVCDQCERHEAVNKKLEEQSSGIHWTVVNKASWQQNPKWLLTLRH